MSQDNQDQAEFWTSNAGPTWVAYEASLDAFMAPVLNRVLARAGLSNGQSVLDIGCGTGDSALAAARLVGAQGYVLAADISATMLGRTRERAAQLEQVHTLLADAADHPFDAGQFDHVISRFGVMFFANPVEAFRNIAASLKPGGKMTFATWGQIPKNPWFTLPAAMAKAELGAPPKSDPDAPGPFALRDIAKTCALLESAGLTDVAGKSEDMFFTLPGGSAEIAALSRHVGPAAGTIKHFEADLAAQDRIVAAIADAYRPFETTGIPAEINFFTATKS